MWIGNGPREKKLKENWNNFSLIYGNQSPLIWDLHIEVSKIFWNEIYSNPHIQRGLWMKFHERCEYVIDLTFRLIIVKIHLNLKSNQDFRCEPKNQLGWTFNLNVAETNQIDDMKILIKCKQNLDKFSLRLDRNQSKVSHQL